MYLIQDSECTSIVSEPKVGGMQCVDEISRTGSSSAGKTYGMPAAAAGRNDPEAHL